MRGLHCSSVLFFISSVTVEAFSYSISKSRSLKSELYSKNDEEKKSRRNFLKGVVASSYVFSQVPFGATAVERAVGAAEKSCREAGDCLQKGDLDGAVGWNWGGKDRCDAADPKCGPDGVLKDAPPSGEPVPDLKTDDGKILDFSNIIEVNLLVGKNERGTLRMGLYGNACPKSVEQALDFLSTEPKGGIFGTSKLMLEEGFGVMSSPVALSRGGALNTIYPQQRLDFGVPSQSIAYAKERKLTKAENFLPQPRPNDDIRIGIADETSPRKHNVAGLISIPKNGIGYGGSGFESDDEAFASAFEVTAASSSDMDKEGRKVIGQLLDESSMEFLARLVSLPTRKGLKGIIPGQNAGPPLIKVSVESVESVSITNNSQTENNGNS